MADFNGYPSTRDEATKALFAEFAKLAHGYPAVIAMNAAMNVIVAIMRHANATQSSAASAWDSFMSRWRAEFLDTHYAANGARRPLRDAPTHIPILGG